MPQPRISSNLDDVRRFYRRTEGAVKDALARDARALRAELQDAAVAILDRDIYQAPIPLRTWELTEDLRKSEQARTRGATIILTNRSRHAGARYALGTPGGRAIRTPGVRSTQWHAEVLRTKRPLIVRRRRESVQRGLRRA